MQTTARKRRISNLLQNKNPILHCELIKNYIFVPVTKNYLQCQTSQQE